MAIGKNKKRPRKGAKKKIVDPFAKKEWYDVRAPAMFQIPNIGKTCVNKTAGKKLASDALVGRVFQASLADLNKDSEDQSFRIIKLICEDVQGSRCLTNFYGMSFTSDKLKSLVRKWQSLIETVVDVKTTDGYTVRLFAIAFTKRRINQIKKTSYAQSSQVKMIRRKITDIINREASNVDLKQMFEKLIAEIIGKQIEKECQGIYPLQHCFIRKCKMVKRPKIDAHRLMELHTETASTVAVVGASQEDTGTPVAQPITAQ